MDIKKLQAALITAARANPPGDAVPYAFEKRIAAQVRALAPGDPLGQWSRALWRAVVPCFGIMVLLGGWSFTQDHANSSYSDLSQQLEHALLAEVEQEQAQEQALDAIW
jgi:hypothetical protein